MIVIWYWFPTLVWVAVVLGFSSDMFSAKHTAAVLAAILNWLVGGVDPHTFLQVHSFLRKSAHFVEYAVLSGLWFRALRGPLRGAWQLRWLVPALLATLTVSVLDEWHQALVPSRRSSPRDVVLDFSAALFAQAVIWYTLRRRGSANAAVSGD